MKEYYDIHTHILPGVDDGARNIGETEEMLRIASEEGIRHIIATPHFAVGDCNPSVAHLMKTLSEVKEAAKRVAPGITITLGNELLDGPGIIPALQAGTALTLAGTRYILVEFMPADSYSKIYHSLRDYIMNGYIPIVAHVERYEELIKQYEDLKEIIKLGAYLQMNAESIIGGIFHRKASYCRRLLEEGYIHFLGSDCHRSDRRVPVMKSALKYLRTDLQGYDSYRGILIDNPAGVLADKYI